MRAYHIPPSIVDILDSYQNDMILRDSEAPYDPDGALRQYLQDVLGVYIERLHGYIAAPENNQDDEAKLQVLLAEICKVKRMLDGSIEPI